MNDYEAMIVEYHCEDDTYHAVNWPRVLGMSDMVLEAHAAFIERTETGFVIRLANGSAEYRLAGDGPVPDVKRYEFVAFLEAPKEEAA
jgi:hypothetical protein